jgi:hypothetical protein
MKRKPVACMELPIEKDVKVAAQRIARNAVAAYVAMRDRKWMEPGMRGDDQKTE